MIRGNPMIIQPSLNADIRQAMLSGLKQSIPNAQPLFWRNSIEQIVNGTAHVVGHLCQVFGRNRATASHDDLLLDLSDLLLNPVGDLHLDDLVYR